MHTAKKANQKLLFIYTRKGGGGLQGNQPRTSGLSDLLGLNYILIMHQAGKMGDFALALLSLA